MLLRNIKIRRVSGIVCFRGLQRYQDFSFLSLRITELCLLLWFHPQAGFYSYWLWQFQASFLQPTTFRGREGPCVPEAHARVPTLTLIALAQITSPFLNQMSATYNACLLETDGESASVKLHGSPSGNQGVSNRENKEIDTAGATNRGPLHVV